MATLIQLAESKLDDMYEVRNRLFQMNTAMTGYKPLPPIKGILPDDIKAIISVAKELLEEINSLAESIANA